MALIQKAGGGGGLRGDERRESLNGKANAARQHANGWKFNVHRALKAILLSLLNHAESALLITWIGMLSSVALWKNKA